MNSYVIIDIAYLNDVDYSAVQDSSADDVTVNKDGTKFIVEYIPPMPSTLSAIPNKVGPYTTGIYGIMESDEWRYDASENE